MRIAVLCLVLAGLAASTAAEARLTPSRAETADAIGRWRNCVLRPVPGEIPDLTCSRGVRRVSVTSLRCRPGDEQGEERVLCRFRTVIEPRGGGSPERRGPECAWLLRDGGEWWIDFWPDADLCEF
jgi:hypothetical protein